MQQACNGGFCKQAIDECDKEYESNNSHFMQVAYIIFSTARNNNALIKFC